MQHIAEHKVRERTGSILVCNWVKGGVLDFCASALAWAVASLRERSSTAC